jgi:pyridoxine/pyridoxamine 5'-phosphate oxidase
MTTVPPNIGLDEKTIDPDPIKQFQMWFNDAIAAKLPLPEAMTLATATPDGKPSARMVLLKQADHDGFVFFTNYRSAKASNWTPILTRRSSSTGRNSIARCVSREVS